MANQKNQGGFWTGTKMLTDLEKIKQWKKKNRGGWDPRSLPNEKRKWLMEAIDEKKLYGPWGKRKKGIGPETLAGHLRKQKALAKNQSSVITPTPAAEKGLKIFDVSKLKSGVSNKVGRIDKALGDISKYKIPEYIKRQLKNK